MGARAMRATPERPFYGSFGWASDTTPRGELEFRSVTWMDGSVLRCRERHVLRGPDGTRVAEHDFAMRPWTDAEVRARMGAAGLRDATIAPGARPAIVSSSARAPALDTGSPPPATIARPPRGDPAVATPRLEARPAGFEPATSRSGGARSIH